jgi:predicted dehydrogenase
MSNKKNKLKIVIIGCGDMGLAHVNAWNDSQLAEITVAVDCDNKRLENFTKKHAIPNGMSDYKKAIEKFKPDVVSVCVPAFLHREVVEFAAQSGCHVFCEKPIALNQEDAQAMIDCCKMNKVQLGVDFQRRYWGNTVFYKKLFADKTLERPVIWKQADVREIRPKILMHDKNGNGGSIIDCGVHWFDVWRYLFDSEPVSVYARGFCFAYDKKEIASIKNKAIDTGVITVEFSSGDIGELTMCWGLPQKTVSYTDETILAKNGMARMIDDVVTVRCGRWQTAEKIETGWTPIITAFAESILEGKPSPVVGEDGLAALRIALAALESIETGKVVLL